MYKARYKLHNADPSQVSAGGASQNNPTSIVTPASGAPEAGTVDVQAQINQALTKQQEQFNTQFKEVTGHSDLKAFTEAQLQQQGKLQELADSHKAGEQKYKSKFEQAAISNALLASSSEALNPAIIKDLLAGKAVVDDKDNVTIDGKPVAEAVKALLAENPFLAKAQGGPGSGAPQNAGSGKQVARAEFERMNPTDQSAYIKNGGIVV
jgi:hypothetical protein